MALYYIDTLFNQNFLEYASYVIKDRAIPHLNDGLKPVQRRILHSLFERDDGKFIKVANIVGHCMQYHPHGDASICSALVVLANKDMFIEKQGNFGNMYTGDEASAARYIECRLLPLARDVLYNPELTEYEPSYDGRSREPVFFPAKIPVVLIMGAEGIAVGMSTKILPHNFNEVLDAMVQSLQGEVPVIYPDFPTGGLIDVSGYEDGNGRVLCRAKLDISDPKKIVIRELPFGQTTETLIDSIEKAVKKGKFKVASINDFTTDKVEIEIKLPRGVQAADVADSLYAFTECESSISVNLLVIKDKKPVQMSVAEVIRYQSEQLLSILERELLLEQSKLLEKLYARTLERIFIEERIYKAIETMKTRETVNRAVKDGFIPFAAELARPLTDDDVEMLLKIPIRRISLYDMNKAKKEIAEINARLRQIKALLKNLTGYAIDFIRGLKEKYGGLYPRRTEITRYSQVDVREVAQKNLKLRYDAETGYLGYGLQNGDVLLEMSDYDKILFMKKNGTYTIVNAPEKIFVDKGLLHCSLVDKDSMADTIYTLVYQTPDKKHVCIKRFTVEKFIIDKSYLFLPDGCKILLFTDRQSGFISVNYKPQPKMRVLEETFNIEDYHVKGYKAAGVRMTSKAIKNIKFSLKKKEKTPEEEGLLF